MRQGDLAFICPTASPSGANSDNRSPHKFLLMPPPPPTPPPPLFLFPFFFLSSPVRHSSKTETQPYPLCVPGHIPGNQCHWGEGNPRDGGLWGSRELLAGAAGGRTWTPVEQYTRLHSAALHSTDKCMQNQRGCTHGYAQQQYIPWTDACRTSGAVHMAMLSSNAFH